ncbi:cyclin-dependent protein kinase complex component, putative [Talaromyces stipitatus ATCC 10500]|uniref:Cyclin-dependent protein kinase complex component, putative n=1 Tax=Talaromyces stipitatus (strain ATCC 10500 / CBS 375.48 / QM 6759 / NRRL 1006) TaxID=441959 RepID=B8M105_TALSN|nr:cyclin-dependent protein kinase complex component, putative [Talaromyces stipitatus ATCC 10500]EED21785.1 cyclin-dependent protein kinase complex component, putative [Talaromyces stipitatus ATCC 10500]
MCLVKRTRRIIGDTERSQQTTYYCPRSRNGRTCSLTRYEDVEKRYQELSSKVTTPSISRRRQSTSKTSRDSIWKVLSGPFFRERSGKPHDDQTRGMRDQQAPGRSSQVQPPSSTQPDIISDPLRQTERADHRRIASSPLVIERTPRDVMEQVRPATAPAHRPARVPRPRTPVEERPRVRQHPVSVHQAELVPEEIEMTGARQPESDIDDHFSTFATFPSSSSSSSEPMTEFEDDETYYEPIQSHTPEEESTVGHRRDREYLYARLEALHAKQRVNDAIRERRELEDLTNGMRHILINNRTGIGAGGVTRRSTNPARQGRQVVASPPERAGDITGDMGGFRRHSSVIARRNFPPRSYVIQEENRRVREESERVIENARARRNTQGSLDGADAFFRERHEKMNRVVEHCVIGQRDQVESSKHNLFITAFPRYFTGARTDRKSSISLATSFIQRSVTGAHITNPEDNERFIQNITVEHEGDGKEHTVSPSQHANAQSGVPPIDERDAVVFQMSATDALKAVTAHLTELARVTGDVPATPYAQQQEQQQQPQNLDDASLDIIAEKQMPAVSITELHWGDVKDISAESTPAGVIQHNVLVKRFYSKKAPPISLEDYLLRLHKYCPMSTAVYLAASLYITRMVFTEKALFVTPRNVHRLVLAALRVAMKALEDLSYPHARFARVGGVAERELTRLEITFCFLTDFDLRVDAHALLCQIHLLQSTPVPTENHNNTHSVASNTVSPEVAEVPS